MSEIEPATPGPWETSDRPHSKGLGALGNPKEWRYVQHNFPEAPYEGELSDEWGIYPPLGEAGPVALVAGESNAKLIAAAPELLTALKDLADRMVERFGETIKHEPVATGKYLDAAYAAIRKAQAHS